MHYRLWRGVKHLLSTSSFLKVQLRSIFFRLFEGCFRDFKRLLCFLAHQPQMNLTDVHTACGQNQFRFCCPFLRRHPKHNSKLSAEQLGASPRDNARFSPTSSSNTCLLQINRSGLTEADFHCFCRTEKRNLLCFKQMFQAARKPCDSENTPSPDGGSQQPPARPVWY